MAARDGVAGGAPHGSGDGTDVATLALAEELADLARWQYESYGERAQARLRELAAVAEAEWTLPLPVVARLLLNTIDGVVLCWLVDRDSEAAVLDGSADTLGSLARQV